MGEKFLKKSKNFVLIIILNHEEVYRFEAVHHRDSFLVS